MNRTGLLLIALLATATILVPTGAVPFDLTGTDSVSDDVVLRPADGPNGDYALLDEDDELKLLLTDANPAIDGEGVSADAVTPLPAVFTMTYTGDRSATVWLTDDADDVRFYRGEDSADSLEGRENSVVLGPGETITAGLLVDARSENDVEQAETFTVNAEVPENGEGADDRDSRDQGNAGDHYGGGPDVLTPTPTPTAQFTRTDSSGGVPVRPDESDDGAQPPTATPTSAEPSVRTPSKSSTAVDGGNEANGAPAELGGGGLATLVTIAAGLLAILIALASYRQFG